MLKSLFIFGIVASLFLAFWIMAFRTQLHESLTFRNDHGATGVFVSFITWVFLLTSMFSIIVVIRAIGGN